MLVVVLENWNAEPEDSLVRFFGRRLCRRFDRAEHVMYAADKQGIFILKMRIER